MVAIPTTRTHSILRDPHFLPLVVPKDQERVYDEACRQASGILSCGSSGHRRELRGTIFISVCVCGRPADSGFWDAMPFSPSGSKGGR